MQINGIIEVEDNVSEVLTMVIEFARRRQELLTENVANYNKPGFVPMEYPVSEFAELMSGAISEHICSERLLLRDGEHVKFGEDGSFEVKPTVDDEALLLFEKDIKAYLELQAKKLSENSINSRLARDLLKQRQMVTSVV